MAKLHCPVRWQKLPLTKLSGLGHCMSSNYECCIQCGRMGLQEQRTASEQAFAVQTDSMDRMLRMPNTRSGASWYLTSWNDTPPTFTGCPRA